jgi:hypothetical protein
VPLLSGAPIRLVSPEETPDEGKSTMRDRNDAAKRRAEAEERLLAAGAADMHRLLEWYYGAPEPDSGHLPYPQADDQAA